MKNCVTHHFACKCREEKTQKLLNKIEIAIGDAMNIINLDSDFIGRKTEHHTVKELRELREQIINYLVESEFYG